MPRKGYVKHTPKNLVRVDGQSLYIIPIQRNGNHDHKRGNTPEIREYSRLIVAVGNLRLNSLKYHSLAVDLNVLPVEVKCSELDNLVDGGLE